jgi:hypothetical protein
MILLYPLYGVVLRFCFILSAKNRKKPRKKAFFFKTAEKTEGKGLPHARRASPFWDRLRFAFLILLAASFSRHEKTRCFFVREARFPAQPETRPCQDT